MCESWRMRNGIEVRLGPGDRERLEAVIGSGNSLQKHVWRARVVVLPRAAGIASRGAGTAWPPTTWECAPVAPWVPATLEFAPLAVWLPIAVPCAPATVTGPGAELSATLTFVPPPAACWEL